MTTHPAHPRSVTTVAVLALVVLGALGLAASGCTPEATRQASQVQPSPTAPSTIVVRPLPVPPGIHVSFVQQRIDEGSRRSQVRVVNGTTRALRVRAVGVDWAGFPGGMQDTPYVIGSEQTVDLPYLLPRAACGSASAGDVIRGAVQTARGLVRRPMTADGRRFLTRIHETTCQARRVDATVGVRFAPRVRAGRVSGRPVLRAHLLLTRPAGGGPAPVTVEQVGGSVLFDLSLPPGGNRALATDVRRAGVPVVVRDGGRCDPHSRGQATQPFSFRAFVGLGEDPVVSRLVVPSPVVQRRLLHFLDRACR